MAMDLVIVSGFLLSILGVYALRWQRRRLPPPPGPRPIPFIGNLLDIASAFTTVRPWETCAEWSKAYDSDVIYLSIPFKPVIILNSVKAALELFEKRSEIYSDRLRAVGIELMKWDFGFPFMQYGPRWRAHRRMFHQHFHASVVDRYQPAQLERVRAFCSWIVKTPHKTRECVRLMVTSGIFAIVYGVHVDTLEHEYVFLAEKGMEGMSKVALPGMHWVDFFPFLRHIPSWVPFTAARRLGEAYAPYVLASRDKPYEEARANMSNNTAMPSMVRDLIEDNERKYGGTADAPTYEEIAKNVAGIAYAAGSDTTANISEFFLVAMAMFPDKQVKARIELDKVVGLHRLPDYEDLVQMPYIRAILMEVVRWLPSLPFVPHAVSSDDIYEGYQICKGTVLIANIYAMAYDPTEYPEPEEFRPERFLDENGIIDDSVQDPFTFVFGFGRRICPGRHVAIDMLLMFMATTLHVFNISPGEGEFGRPVQLSKDVIGGAILKPKVVPCGLKPRSETVVQLIHEATLGSK